MELFPKDDIVGVFRGFRDGGMEFHADLALPYRSEFQNLPMHGQFLLVQLESPDEAVLGRITSLSSEGRLSGAAGEDFTLRATREGREIPEHLREDFLKYRINIRVLGMLRNSGGNKLTFVPSHRRLPHVGSPVAFPSKEVLRDIVGHNVDGAEVGFLALGEYIYAKGDDRLERLEWMQIKSPSVVLRFPIDDLVSRRTFIFARAGFGKSNLNKLLFSKLYETTPVIEKRGGRKVPVGTLLFDPDGEYFWPDDRGRPGLCDVPALEDKIVVFTGRRGPSPFYQSFVAGGIRLDIRRFRPSDVISIALPPERQDQQNVRKLRGLNPARWERLVDIIDRDGNDADLDEVKELLRLESGQDAESLAARANMTTVVRTLHDKSSQLLDMLMDALKSGKLCIVDVSQLRGGPSLTLSGLILRRIFDRNQQEFTKAEPDSIPTIAVVEEAQSVLNDKAPAATPYIEWVKEGRKYDLGALLITQQPGSIPNEILSQGDNWFIFHLLSSGDLGTVRKANAHFSQDILSSLLNEPIPGQGVFWSSARERAYPIPVRILNFERLYERRDIEYILPPAQNSYAVSLRNRFEAEVQKAIADERKSHSPPRVDDRSRPLSAVTTTSEIGDNDPGAGVDVLALRKKRAIDGLGKSPEFQKSINHQGIAWYRATRILEEFLPDTMDNRNGIAYQLVPEAMNQLLGPRKEAWDTERRVTKNGKSVLIIFKK